MINIKEKKDCCGCGACVQKCPLKCISLITDHEGFAYPQTDVQKCIQCGLCIKICPVINQKKERIPLECNAAQNLDKRELSQSSSGGLFIILAKYVLSQKGVVVGVVFDENWGVKHVASQNEECIRKMMGSKYVQSDTCETFRETEKYLKKGVLVLYSGTPCQIAGLKQFLHIEYSNLITLDFICHGVPSPLVWQRYLHELNNSNIENIEFRNKAERGWKKYSIVIKRKSSSSIKNSIVCSEKHHNNLFMKGFLSDLILRPSCYDCPVKSLKSGSDITIADFWSVERVLPQWVDDDKGTSLLLINTEKGISCFQQICDKMKLQSMDYKSVLEYNSSLIKSAVPHKNREKFFMNFETNKHTLNNLVIRYCYDTRGKIKLYIRLFLQHCGLYNK